MYADISVFGDSLEVPEEVPTFVREMTPTLLASGGTASSTVSSGVAADSNDHHGMKRTYDHLFEEEDGDFTVGENSAGAGAGAGAAAGATEVANDTTQRTTGDIIFAQGIDTPPQQPTSVLPAVVAAPKTMTKKKTKFKVKPLKKGATKPLNK